MCINYSLYIEAYSSPSLEGEKGVGPLDKARRGCLHEDQGRDGVSQSPVTTPGAYFHQQFQRKSMTCTVLHLHHGLKIVEKTTI